MNQPESAKLGFFAACPKCKKKFMVEPRFIAMYLSRIIERYKNKHTGVGHMLAAAQQELKGVKAESGKEGR